MISLSWFSLCKIAWNFELLFFRDLKLFISSVRASPFPQHLSCCTTTVTFNNLFRLFGSKLLWIYLYRKHLKEPTQKSINEQLLTSLRHSQTCIPEKHISGIRIEGINILCTFWSKRIRASVFDAGCKVSLPWRSHSGRISEPPRHVVQVLALLQTDPSRRFLFCWRDYDINT